MRVRGFPILRRVVLESLPILVAAGIVDLIAGMTIERRLDAFITYPALLAEICQAESGVVRNRDGTSGRLSHLGDDIGIYLDPHGNRSPISEQNTEPELSHTIMTVACIGVTVLALH